MHTVITKLKQIWQLIKSLQTGLLLITGLAGYLSARCPMRDIYTVFAVAGSLFLAISGSTILNMWYDRDIDSKMGRTCMRPLASGSMSPREAFLWGMLFSGVGLAWAFSLDVFYFWIVFAGLFFDVIVYTVWLKRRSAWSIIWGGIAGGMPVLAGRVLVTGSIDWIGIVLCLSILFWIPTHIMTFNIKYFQDYETAGIPTFPARYGFANTRRFIAVSSIIAAVCMGAAALGLGLFYGIIRLQVVLSIGLLLIACVSLYRPTEKINFGLFKYASLYMLGSMILLVI